MVYVDPTIAQVLAFAMLAIAAYSVFIKFRQAKLKTTVPQYRNRPQVLTEMGLLTMKTTTPLSANKYMVEYEGEQGYKKIYTKLNDFDELIPVYPNQIITGDRAPMYMEYKVLLERAYTYEDAPTREMLKKQVAQIAASFEKRGMSKGQTDEQLAKLQKIAMRLSETPSMQLDLVKQIGKKTDETLKYESDLRASQSAVEGAVERRSQQLERVASAAAKKSGRDREER